jgi:hypothetical protein
MTEPDHASTTARLAEALRLSAEFRAAARTDVAAFLAEHAGLRDLLEGMLSDPELSAEPDAVPPTPAIAGIDLPAAFGDYVVERELGRGGVGIVVAAQQRSLGRRVALKLLSRPLLASRALVRFQREARLLARLEHHGIVRVIDAGMVGSVPYYAMDFVDGAPLSVVIDAVRRHGLATATGATVMAAVTGTLERDETRPPAPTSTAAIDLRTGSYCNACAELCAQVADALAFAHAAGVVHRDVKPSNVLLRRDGTAVLSDFGLARQEDAPSLTFSGEFAGTPFYVSPEQARGDAIDHRTDVYSLGVTLYELLTLQRPFDAATTAQVLTRIQREEAIDPQRSNAAVPDDLAAIVLKAMAKEPALRYASAGALAADLRAWRQGDPIVARRPTRWQRLRRFVRREPWQAAALGTAITAAAVVVVLYVGFTSRVIAERETAHQNLDQAMAAVDEFLSKVGRQDFEHIPQMSGIRRDLLQRAAQFYEGFLAQRAHDARMQQRLASAHVGVGYVRHFLGDAQAAVGSLRAAIAGFDAIIASGNADAAVRAGRADAQAHLGYVLKDLRQHDAARATLDEAIAALQALPAAAARGRSPRSTLAHALTARSDLLRRSDISAARTDVRAAVAQLEQLQREGPTTDDDAQLAMHRLTLATLEIQMGNTAAAESLLATARDDADQLAARAPEHAGVRRLACLTRDQLAVLYHDTGRPEPAIDSAAAAVQRWQQVVADFPLVPDYREHLGRSWSNLAGMRTLGGDHAGAAQAAREATSVQEALVAAYPGVPRYQVRLVRALRSRMTGWLSGATSDAGEHATVLARALTLAENLHRESPQDTDYAKTFADVLIHDVLLARQQGSRERARHSSARAMEVTAVALARNPHNDELRDAHGNALGVSAEEAYTDGNHAAALDLVERGLAQLRPGLLKETRHPARRRFMRLLLDGRVQVLVAKGDHENLAATLAERAAFCDTADDCYGVATRAALAAKTASGPPRDALLEHGLRLLRECVKLGFADAERLEADADLAELRADRRFGDVRRALAAR